MTPRWALWVRVYEDGCYCWLRACTEATPEKCWDRLAHLEDSLPEAGVRTLLLLPEGEEPLAARPAAG